MKGKDTIITGTIKKINFWDTYLMKHINEITSDKIKLFDNLVELPNNLLAASDRLSYSINFFKKLLCNESKFYN